MEEKLRTVKVPAPRVRWGACAWAGEQRKAKHGGQGRDMQGEGEEEVSGW